MAYPTTLDSFTANVDNVDVIYASDVNELQTAITSLEAKIGVDSSAVTTSHDYKLSAVTGSNKAVPNNGATIATPTITGATITTSTVNGVTLQTTGSATDFLNAAGSYVNGAVTNASTTVAGLSEEATQAEVDAGTATGGTGANLYVNPSTLRPVIGGNGSDGALTVSSGTTNIDLGSVAFFVKNYSSISITGTGKITFTNPHANGTTIVLKSKGDVTLTSSQAPMIDASNLGATGGAGYTSTTNGVTTGNPGTSGVSPMLTTGGGGGSTNAATGSAGTLASLSFANASFTTTKQKYSILPVASGGGSAGGQIGSNQQLTVTAGGRGGGTLVIECGGALNFTTASGISVAGQAGGSSTSAGTSTFGGGSAGGAGGYFLCVYNTLTANSGTVTVTGGTGGNNDNQSASIRYGAGSGALLSAGSAGTSSATVSAKTGADGATGVSLVISSSI